MGTIHEVKQVLWVNTPHGEGQVLFLMDYGIHENLIFVVALTNTGEIKHYITDQITICPNYTIELNIKKNE